MRVRTALAVAILLVSSSAARAQIESYAVVGGSEVRIGKGVHVEDGGVESNGTASFKTSSVAEDLVVADTLRGAAGVVWQDIFYNHVEPRGAVFLGSSVSGVAMPFLTLPPPVFVAPSPSYDIDV